MNYLPECPNAYFSGGAGKLCLYLSGLSAAGCECQEMVDGSGTYPTLQDCQQDPGSCCNVNPSTKFCLCSWNYIKIVVQINNVANKDLSAQPNLGDNLAQYMDI